jgi:hypothetical protein
MIISVGMLGFDKTFTLVPAKYRDTPNIGTLGYLLIVEALFTMIFVSTVLFVKYRRVSATTDGMLSNLTVAISLYVCVRMAGPLSGAGLNPSIAIAIIITDTISRDLMAFLPSYILGPLLGGFLAAMLLKLSVKISNDTEGPVDESTEQPKYEIGQSNSTIQDHNVEEDLSFDEDGRRGSNRGMTVLTGRKSSVGSRKQTGLQLKTARDYMA